MSFAYCSILRGDMIAAEVTNYFSTHLPPDVLEDELSAILGTRQGSLLVVVDGTTSKGPVVIEGVVATEPEGERASMAPEVHEAGGPQSHI